MKLQLASASGNAFGYFWADEVPASFRGPAWARALCLRGKGLGIDGIFLLQRPDGSRWRMDHWDADGSFTFCSNGSRAALGLVGAPEFPTIEAVSSDVSCELRNTPEGIAIRMPEGAEFGLRPLPFEVVGAAGFGLIGNPQLVIEVPSVDAVDLAQLAPPLRHEPTLPGGTNVNIVEIVQPGHARIRSWERGVEGETLCCGTGCAVTAAWLSERTGVPGWTMETTGGEPVTVSLEWQSPGCWKNLWLAGPVKRIGTLELDPGMMPS